MNRTNYIEQLLTLTEKATSQFHTVEAVKEQLSENGYEELFLKDNWELKKGGKYMVIHHGSSVFAFSVGENFQAADGFRIAAAHGIFQDSVSNRIRKF